MVTLVGPSWVEERLGSRDFLVLDPRGRMKHLQGHLKESISLPVTRLFGNDDRLMPPRDLAELFGAAGLTDAVVPVLYDSYDGQRGAFMAWVLEYLGRSDVHVMDTFFEGWMAQEREVFYRPVKPTAGSFTAHVALERRAILEQVQDRGTAKLLDVRSVEEFSGEPEFEARPGHIPGATNLPWREFLGTDHRILNSAHEIERRLNQVGISPDDSVISYCRIGIRAAIGYLSLQQLGYAVRLYDGSYAEWAGADLPVETMK